MSCVYMVPILLFIQLEGYILLLSEELREYEKRKSLHKEFTNYFERFPVLLHLNPLYNYIKHYHKVLLSELDTYYPYECFSYRFTRIRGVKKCSCKECLIMKKDILEYRDNIWRIHSLSHLPFERKNLKRVGIDDEKLQANEQLQIKLDENFVPYNL